MKIEIWSAGYADGTRRPWKVGETEADNFNDAVSKFFEHKSEKTLLIKDGDKWTYFGVTLHASEEEARA